MSTATHISTTAGWEAVGQHRELRGHRVFTIDAPSIGPEVHEPLLILHGFPTSSFDYAAVLDALRRGRRLLSMPMRVGATIISRGISPPAPMPA